MEQSKCDVRMSGYLRKQKSLHRRFFVLRAASQSGPARLEYYENEKKYRNKAATPKRALGLDTCFNINKRVDARNKHLIVLYTRSDTFGVAAECAAQQEDWYRALVELHCRSKVPSDSGASDYGIPCPGPAFKEVWQVKVWPKGLGQSRNLVGVYRLCLTERTVNFVKLNSEAAAVILQLMNVRRCGHSENFFFVEVGRSAVTGPGEFWMQVEDSVVAQNMHETLLEAMKALSEECRQRSKSQSSAAPGGGGTASNPISVPPRRVHPHPHPPPSQVGFTRRPRSEPPGSSPTSPRGFGRDCNRVDDIRDATPRTSSPSSSCTTTPVLRSVSLRGPPPSRPTTGLVRSVSIPRACPAPSMSPGSASRLIPHASVSNSGSLSDCGSSDEYASSPSEQDPPGCDSHSLGDEASNYILMGQQGTGGSMQSCRLLQCSSVCDGGTERWLLSKRASLPAMSLDPPFSCHKSEEDSSYTSSQDAFESHQDSPVASKMVEDVLQDVGGDGKVGLDQGYMSMQPGVTASPSSLSHSFPVSVSSNKPVDDYMAMTPSSGASPPHPNDGYMMMSPHSSCSPEHRVDMGGTWPGGDYMNMSPISSPAHSESRGHQLFPKTVYSYYSLPRSYKHSPSKGRSTTTGVEHRRGLESSAFCSSSSYSSSSASSESLGEVEERPIWPNLRARGCGKESGVSQNWVQQHSRPLSLFVDVSKSNTLPRVRETQCSGEAKSPGEYVSIEFQANHAISSTTDPKGGFKGRPFSCLGGFQPFPPSCPVSDTPPLPSEYVNMELGPSTSPSAFSLSLANFSSFQTPPTPSAVSPNLGDDFRESSGRGEDKEDVENGMSGFGDYTQMAFGTSTKVTTGFTATPEATHPKCEATGPSAFSGTDASPSKVSSNLDPGAKVMRADPQGRLPCSETPVPQPTSASGTSFVLEHTSCWQGGEGVTWVNGATPEAHGVEQGLNYIDLDLANRESQHPTTSVVGPGQMCVPGGGVAGASNLNTYASIDFCKSEELRSQQNGSKDSTDS